jgi:hypothetical protein
MTCGRPWVLLTAEIGRRLMLVLSPVAVSLGAGRSRPFAGVAHHGEGSPQRAFLSCWAAQMFAAPCGPAAGGAEAIGDRGVPLSHVCCVCQPGTLPPSGVLAVPRRSSLLLFLCPWFSPCLDTCPSLCRLPGGTPACILDWHCQCPRGPWLGSFFCPPFCPVPSIPRGRWPRCAVHRRMQPPGSAQVVAGRHGRGVQPGGQAVGAPLGLGCGPVQVPAGCGPGGMAIGGLRPAFPGPAPLTRFGCLPAAHLGSPPAWGEGGVALLAGAGSPRMPPSP